MNRLYSPVNGEVIAKNLAPGDFVTGGVSVITIADMDKTQIRTEYIGSSVLDRASGYQAVINGKNIKLRHRSRTFHRWMWRWEISRQVPILVMKRCECFGW